MAILLQSAFERADRTSQWQCDPAHTAMWVQKCRPVASARDPTHPHRAAHCQCSALAVRIIMALEHNEIEPNRH